MKILCTADWHIGKRLGPFSRFEEQVARMDEICTLAEAENPHAVIIAGDCFDTAAPSPEHIRLFVRTAARLTRGGSCPVLAIAGNHDSPLLLSSTEAFASQVGVAVLGRPQDTPVLENAHPDWSVDDTAPGVLQIFFKKAKKRVRFLLAPYADARRLKKDLGAEDTDLKAWEILQNQWKENINPETSNILVAHHFVLPEPSSGLYQDEAPAEDEGEKKIGGAGGINAVPLANLPEGIDYLVLGHIHKPAKLRSSKTEAFYTGSPLIYSLSEGGQDKSLLMLELGKEKTHRLIPLKPAADVKRICLDSMEGAASLLASEKDNYIEIVWAGERFLESAERRLLEDSHPRILGISSTVRMAAGEGEDWEAAHMPEPLELFREYFASKFGGRDAPESAERLFEELSSEPPKSPLPKKRGFLPLSLVLEGFYSYKKRAEVDFTRLGGQGLFGVFGVVGSGKSALIEAVIFALYDQTKRLGERKSKTQTFTPGYNMMNLDSNALFVEFMFEVLDDKNEKETYKITLSAKRDKKSGEISSDSRIVCRKENAEWIPLAKGEDSGEQLLGLSYNDFRQTVILQQRDFMGFLEAKPTDNANMLQRLFHLERFDLGDNAKTLENELAGAFGKIETLLQTLEWAAPENEAGLLADEQALERDLAQNKTMLAEERLEEKTLLQKKDQYKIRTALEEGLSQTRQALDSAEIRLKALLPETERLQKEQEAAEKNLAGARLRLAEISPLLDAEDPAPARESARLRDVLQRIERALEKERALLAEGGCSSLEELSTMGRTLKVETERLPLASAVLLLKEGAPCPLCGSLHHPSPYHAGEGGEELKTRLEKLQKLYGQVSQIQKDRNAEEQGRSYKELQTECALWEQRCRSQQESIGALKQESKILDARRNEGDRVLRALQEALTQNKAELSRQETAAELHTQRMAQLNAQISDLPVFQKQEDILRLVEDNAGQIAALEARQKDILTQQGGLQKKRLDLIKALEQKKGLLQKAEGLRLRRDEAKLMTDLFKASGFVKFIGHKYLARLCHSANKRFSAFTGGRFLLLPPESFEKGIVLLDVLNGGRKRDLATLSGGQSFQAALALAAALADESGAGGRFFFIDEGFGSLDEENLDAVMSTLARLAEENTCLIGLISHVGLLHESLPACFRVFLDQDGSRLEFEIRD